MRRIQTTNEHERRFKHNWMDAPVEWDGDQTAAVDDEDDDAIDSDVAERLVDERDDITLASDSGTETDPAEFCPVELSSGDICGRPRPCHYHDDGDGDD